MASSPQRREHAYLACYTGVRQTSLWALAPLTGSWFPVEGWLCRISLVSL